jgi:hypothetical protein
MGMVLDILSGKRFPFLVASTMMHPPFTAAKKRHCKNPTLMKNTSKILEIMEIYLPPEMAILS